MPYTISSWRGALVLTGLLHATSVLTSAIAPRATGVTAPIAFTPDQNWYKGHAQCSQA